jgi:hypothetical protein
MKGSNMEVTLANPIITGMWLGIGMAIPTIVLGLVIGVLERLLDR